MAAEDGFEGLFAQKLDVAAGFFEEAVDMGDVQKFRDEAVVPRVGVRAGRDFAGSEPFDLLAERVDASAEIAGFGAFGAKEPTGLAGAAGVFLRGDVRFQRARGARLGQRGESERRARGGGGCFVAGCLPPPIGRAGLPDGAFRIGISAGGEGVLQDVVEAQGAAVFRGRDGDEMEGALGAGHGDVEEAELFEGLALAIGVELRGEDGLGFDDFGLG